MKKLALAVIALCFSVGVNAACDVKSLKGDYSIGVVGGNANESCAVIGVATFDGKGAVKIFTSTGCGGEPVLTNSTGMYLVTTSCMGTAGFTNGSIITFVFDKMFKAGQLSLSQNGSVAFGSLLKQ